MPLKNKRETRKGNKRRKRWKRRNKSVLSANNMTFYREAPKYLQLITNNVTA